MVNMYKARRKMKRENGNIQKTVMLNSFQHLHLNQSLSKAEEILNQVQDDNRQQGFTLIELLVVVLIIGILVAVALPQYQKAVEKARLAEALSVIEQAQRAVDLWYLAGEDKNIESGVEPFVTGSSTWKKVHPDVDPFENMTCLEEAPICTHNGFLYVFNAANNTSNEILRMNDEEVLYSLGIVRSTTGEWMQGCHTAMTEYEYICDSLKSSGRWE